MSESFIGWWAQRHGQKAHLVESEVTDRLVMRCGRQMRMETAGGPLKFTEYTGLAIADDVICEQCEGHYRP